MKIKAYSALCLALMFLYGCDSQPPPNSSFNSGSKVLKKVNSANALPDYKTARNVFWRSLYNGRVKSLYCNESFNSDQRRGYNIEHVFPMSWATNGLQCGTRKQCQAKSKNFNRVEADLHNLYPSRSDVNKERSSFRFGVVAGEKREFGGCDFEVDYRARAAEPSEQSRGEVARAMFYMAYQHKELGLQLFEKQANLLIKWHKLDPPSSEERRRNDVIEDIQGNRNPFIDQPETLTKLQAQGYFSDR